MQPYSHARVRTSAGVFRFRPSRGCHHGDARESVRAWRQARHPIQVHRADEHDARRLHGRAGQFDRHDLAARHLSWHPPQPTRARQLRVSALDPHGLRPRYRSARGHPGQDRRHLRPGENVQPRIRGVHGRVNRALGCLEHRRCGCDPDNRLPHGSGGGRCDAHGELGCDHHRRLSC